LSGGALAFCREQGRGIGGLQTARHAFLGERKEHTENVKI